MMGIFCSLGSIANAETDPIYPFKVSINGQEAVKGSVFAEVEGTVPSNSKIEVEGEGQVIVNIFKADASGNPQAGAAPALLLFEAPKGALDKLLSGEKLKSGKYRANFVANGATSIIVFTVK